MPDLSMASHLCPAVGLEWQDFNQYNTDVAKFDATHSQPDRDLDEFQLELLLPSVASHAQREFLPDPSAENIICDANWSTDSINVVSQRSAHARSLAIASILTPYLPILCQNKSFTDVTFIVGPPQHSKKYVGHRVLLAMTSPGK